MTTLFDRIETLVPSPRGELEVTDLNMLYVKEGSCKGYLIDSYWSTGTFDSILDTSIYIRIPNILRLSNRCLES